MQRARRGNGWSWLSGFALAAACAWAGRAAPGRAQALTGGEEVIADPELENVAPPPAPAAAPAPEPNGRVRVVLRSRLGMDVRWDDPREDVWEATQLALFEARVRRSERVSFEVGLRARHVFMAREHDTPDADAARHQLDLAPTAAFADLMLSAPLHLRLGYQSVQLGRFDVLNPSDFLSARDLRSGPTSLPEASEIAQPAARLDWDASAWLSLRAIVLPFFQPHVIHGFEGDYALSPARQADIDVGYDTLAPNGDDDAQRLRALVRDTLSRSGQAELAESTLQAFAPEPNLSSPQAALRAVAHGSAGELGATIGVAREHLPALHFSDAYLDVARAFPDPATMEQDQALLDDTRPIALEYGRFAVASLDGALVLGPVLLGAELAYIHGRTLFAVQPQEPPLPGESDLAHAGLRFEYVAGSELAIVVEGSAERALSDSRAPGGDWLLLTEGRYMLAAVGFVAYSPVDSGWTFELGGGAFSGPSYLIAPRIEAPIVGTLYAEAGAYFVGGQGSRNPADASVSLGAVYEDIDQVFVGLRWLP